MELKGKPPVDIHCTGPVAAAAVAATALLSGQALAHAVPLDAASTVRSTAEVVAPRVVVGLAGVQAGQVRSREFEARTVVGGIASTAANSGTAKAPMALGARQNSGLAAGSNKRRSGRL